MNEELYKKLCKIKELVEKGIGGEADNAAAMFDHILARNGLTIADFEAFGEREGKYERKMILDSFEDRLFGQVAISLGMKVYAYRKERVSSKGKTSYVRDKKSLVARFELLFDSYLIALNKELEATLIAFVAVNNIYRPDGNVSQRPL